VAFTARNSENNEMFNKRDLAICMYKCVGSSKNSPNDSPVIRLLASETRGSAGLILFPFLGDTEGLVFTVSFLGMKLFRGADFVEGQ
jgi:hypothetical protein